MFKPVTTAKQRTMNIPVISNPIPATIFFIQYTPFVKLKYRKTPTSRVHSAMFKGAHSHPRCSYIHIFAVSITIPPEDVSRRKAMPFFRSSENRNSVSTNESALFGPFLKAWYFFTPRSAPHSYQTTAASAHTEYRPASWHRLPPELPFCPQ